MTIEQLIARHTEELQERHDAIERLRLTNHGHRFGDDRQCKCGLSQRDYHALTPSERGTEVCPL